MKNINNLYIIATSALFFIFPANAQDVVRDIPASLETPAPIIQQSNLPPDNIVKSEPAPLVAALPSPQRAVGKQSFINTFCNGVIPPKPGTEAQQSCMDTQKQEACERFSRAAVNIQRIMSQAIDCEADNSNGQAKSDCDSTDASRLDLLKQYWDDEDSSYTILFLPDMVFNSAATCEAPVAAKSGAK